MTVTPSDSPFLLELLGLLSGDPAPVTVCQFLALRWPCVDKIQQTAIMEVEQDASIQLTGSFGFSAQALEPLQRVSLWDELPGAQAIREQRIVTLANPAEVKKSFPNLNDPALRIGGLILAPVLSSGRAIGACTVITHTQFDAPEDSEQQLNDVCVALGLYLSSRQRATALLRTGPIAPIQPSPNGQGSRTGPDLNPTRNTLVPNQLTERQLTVLQCLAKGLTNRQIAMRMGFSESTIRQETMAIYAFFGVRGRTDAVESALIRGMVKPHIFDEDDDRALTNE